MRAHQTELGSKRESHWSRDQASLSKCFVQTSEVEDDACARLGLSPQVKSTVASASAGVSTAFAPPGSSSGSSCSPGTTSPGVPGLQTPPATLYPFSGMVWSEASDQVMPGAASGAARHELSGLSPEDHAVHLEG
jgi:hypothetical protein